MRRGVFFNTTSSTARLLVRFHPVNRFLYLMVRIVNVSQRPLLQALRKLVVLFLRDILVCPVQKLQRMAQSPAPIQIGIHWRVIVYVFPVVNRRLLDLFDGGFDLMHSLILFVAQLASVVMLQISARRTQIRQCVQIRRVPALGKRAAAAERKEQRKYHSRNDNAGNCFHGFDFS